MGRGRADSDTVACGSICCLILTVIAAGLVGGSFQIVEPNEYGLLYNTISKEFVANRVYSSGRYFVGLAKAFQKYPRTQRPVFFGAGRGADRGALTVQLTDGSVTVDCSMQYALPPTKLLDVYRKYGTNYHTRYVNMAASVLQKVFVDNGLNSTQFYTNRALVTSVARQNLTYAFAADNAELKGFQLRRTVLPSAVESSIVNRQITEQRTQTELNVQAQENIRAQITVVIGLADQDIALYEAGQRQIANVVRERALAEAKNVTLAASGLAYETFQRSLGFSNSELLKFLYYKNLRSASPSTTLALDFADLSSVKY